MNAESPIRSAKACFVLQIEEHRAGLDLLSVSNMRDKNLCVQIRNGGSRVTSNRTGSLLHAGVTDVERLRRGKDKSKVIIDVCDKNSKAR